ncbi:P-loop containing nucleoside triphosphate hydrolase protein [Lentithecium fluviatile CBS 122367]|uniref:P-loop containing nucleoside triphosphate hydrolase protein n=1 Tax=Lentithecium fluviatile CBS 122367 TaxID=1168545 RepID=A0A6G1J4D7_9PLEO|nr:P-loop containing nucleoside triphosphate hydrolase protein [Lentithecium fluviatile CBS 122367]
MDQLYHIPLDLPPPNGTFTSLPSTLLEAFIPGYGLVHQLISRFFHFDIGFVGSGIFVVLGLHKACEYVYTQAYGIFADHFTSAITIEDHDRLFFQIMEWIGEQRMTRISRDLKAITKRAGSDDDDDDDVLDESGFFNYEKWAGNIPPRYEPNYGSNTFHFKGRKFTFTRTAKEKTIRESGEDDEYLRIVCAGRSTQPIKDLLEFVKSWALRKEHVSTVVYRPSGQGDYPYWDKQSCRPSRPMSTVSLEIDQKASIVMDVNEYLHPITARWYAARGIPYRRGYLFHGAPGTGKTSLSFALAGIFGLDIYCISLMEVGLTESGLNKLFMELPRRCVVLLEDIDAAGLRRPDDTPESSDASGNGTTSEDGTTKTDSKTKTQAPQRSLISLSGLLNVIDGAASHEGRVLIMTTNHLEKLDPALIRPGRCDMQIEFTLATRNQTRDIFTRMYSNNDAAPMTTKTGPSAKVATRGSSGDTLKSPEDDRFLELIRQTPVLEVVEPEKLKAMAEQFAEQVPECTFSPAEIQGFLLTRKKEPSRALKEIGAWRDALLEKRKEAKEQKK